MNICTYPKCPSKIISKGYCGKHYAQKKRSGEIHTTQEMHGMSYTREWKTYEHMVARCYRKTDPSYKHYGGKGVRVCRRWKESFIAFYKDMGDRPENMSLDRINVYGDYEPKNCRWADSSLQNINRRSRSNTGYIGVTRRPNGKYEVTFREKYIGKYDKLDDAVKARKKSMEEFMLEGSHAKGIR